MVDPADLGPLTRRTFAAVIFDNDGTLVDSTPAVMRSWTTWAHEYGVPPEKLGSQHGLPARDIIRILAPDADIEQALERITRLELDDLDDVIALPGAVEAMRALSPDACAVATSATRDLGIGRLEAAGIVVPDVVVTVDDVTRGKPDPEPFLLAARRLGVDPANCLVVEDAPSGLAAAHAAGCATLALTTTTAADSLDADAVVPDLASVIFTRTATGVTMAPAR